MCCEIKLIKTQEIEQEIQETISQNFSTKTSHTFYVVWIEIQSYINVGANDLIY